MDWIKELFTNQESIAHNALVLAIVISAGLRLGRIKIFGVFFGVAGVLFSGLIFGHFGLTLDHTILEFVREFGLILFVYAVGLTVGPGFFNALKAQGLKLNLLATAIVVLGLGITVATSALFHIPIPVAAGIFSGATTNTPSLAAASQVLRDQPPSVDQALAALRAIEVSTGSTTLSGPQALSELTKLPGLGYAVAYPFGVIGIILTMLLMQLLFKVGITGELEDPARKHGEKTLPRVGLRVTNPNLVGLEVLKIPALRSLEVVISRVQRDQETFLANDGVTLILGDILVAVGERSKLDELRLIVGDEVTFDPIDIPSNLHFRWLTVSQGSLVGKGVADLKSKSHPIQITRLRRAGVELPPLRDVRINLGDEVHVVGEESAIEAVAREVGDDPKKLAEPELIPIFIGIALGVLLGTLPITLPGLPSAMRLGLAGGPLIVAILLSRTQRVGSLVWYLPAPASLLLKEMGICLFLAAVGLKSGDRFIQTLLEGQGLQWMATGALVTFLPLIIVAIVGYKLLKVPYLTLVGLLAGSMTDPPALAFAISRTNSETPSVAYATVYPLTMILRVFLAQILMIFWVAS